MIVDPNIAVTRGRIADLVRTPLLAPDEVRRAESLSSAAAASFVAGRTLLRRLLGRWLSHDPKPIRITNDPDERPRLERDDSDLDFNVAHSGDFVLVAIASGRRVGVDVEQISKRRPVTAIADAALGPDAAYELRRLPVARRAARFTCWWVRLEAVCKATGAGLMFPVDDTIPPGFTVRDVAMPAGYRAAVAWSAA